MKLHDKNVNFKTPWNCFKNRLSYSQFFWMFHSETPCISMHERKPEVPDWVNFQIKLAERPKTGQDQSSPRPPHQVTEWESGNPDVLRWSATDQTKPPPHQPLTTHRPRPGATDCWLTTETLSSLRVTHRQGAGRLTESIPSPFIIRLVKSFMIKNFFFP